ncbi:hypothetical protein JS531_02630 [Bifidobacterium sp. CP2]|uniref:YncE family protein n=1 Tax=Bifidobacterium sp. CP2 TaxID=2809025 RepID=UPI001BDC44A2|nr:WD40 repeat domain-containing protein [Bifidobacterium sp. CP2]MBT1180886.1 hypothetical protein [Bifidobacterium sp. CP2]
MNRAWHTYHTHHTHEPAARSAHEPTAPRGSTAVTTIRAAALTLVACIGTIGMLACLALAPVGVTAPGAPRTASAIERTSDGAHRATPAKAGADGQSRFSTDPQRITLDQSPLDVTFSPDGTRLYVTDISDTLHVIDAKTGKEQGTLPDAKYAVTDEVGKRLLLENPGDDGDVTLTVTDAKTLKTVAIVKLGKVGNWQLTHDGTRIIAVENENDGRTGDHSTVHIFDTSNGKETGSFDVTHETHSPLVVAPKDGSCYFVAGTDGTIRRVDATTFKVTGTAKVPAGTDPSYPPALRPADDHGSTVWAYNWSEPNLYRVHMDDGSVDHTDTGDAQLVFVFLHGDDWYATLNEPESSRSGTLSVAPITGVSGKGEPKLGKATAFATSDGTAPSGSMDGSVIYYEAATGRSTTLYAYDVTNGRKVEPMTIPQSVSGSYGSSHATASWDGSRFAVPDGNGKQVLIYDLERGTSGATKDGTGDGASGKDGEGQAGGNAADGSDGSDGSSHGWKPWMWIGVAASGVALAVAVVLVGVFVARRRGRANAAPAVPGGPIATGGPGVPGAPSAPSAPSVPGAVPGVPAAPAAPPRYAGQGVAGPSPAYGPIGQAARPNAPGSQAISPYAPTGYGNRQPAQAMPAQPGPTQAMPAQPGLTRFCPYCRMTWTGVVSPLCPRCGRPLR